MSSRYRDTRGCRVFPTLGLVTGLGPIWLGSPIIQVVQYWSAVPLNLSKPSDPNHPYCQYCEQATYHEYDPFVHQWICQTCFAGMIRSAKNDPLSVIRGDLTRTAVNIAKFGYNLEIKKQLVEIAGRLRKLAES